MDLFNGVVTKKNTLLFSALVSAGLVLANWFTTLPSCSHVYGACSDKIYEVSIQLLPIFPLFALSLFAYFFRDDIFRTWIKFALVWIPFTMLCTAAAPEYSQSLLPIVKSSVAFYLSVVFVIISLLIIFVKWFLSLKK